MYQLVSARLSRKGSGAKISPVDISQVKMFDLMALYDRGYIELSNPALSENIRVTLFELARQNLPFSNVTFTQWLGSLGARTIQGSPVISAPAPTVRYQDILTKHFMVDLVHPSYDESLSVSRDKLTAAYVEPSINYNRYFTQWSLFTVNGLLHRHEPYRNGVRIFEAASTLQKCGENTIGRLDFTGVGKVAIIPLRGQIHALAAKPLSHGFVVDAGRPLSGVSVLISIGGYLHSEEDLLTIVNPADGLVYVDARKIRFAERIANSRDRTNLDAALGQESLNEQVLGYLELSQSFLIVVDSPNLHFTYSYPEYTGLPGRYLDSLNRNYPLMGANGLILNYVYQVEDGVGVYTTQLGDNAPVAWLDAYDPQGKAMMSGAHHSRIAHGGARFCIISNTY